MADTTNTDKVVLTDQDTQEVLKRVRANNPNLPQDHGALDITWDATKGTGKTLLWGTIPLVGPLIAGYKAKGYIDESAAASAADNKFEDQAAKIVRATNADTGDGSKVNEAINAELPSLMKGMGRSGLFALLFGGLGLLGGNMLGGGGGMLAFLGAASAIGYTLYNNYQEREAARKPLQVIADEVQQKKHELELEQQRKKEQGGPGTDKGQGKGKDDNAPSSSVDRDPLSHTSLTMASLDQASLRAAMASAASAGVVVSEPESVRMMPAHNSAAVVSEPEPTPMMPAHNTGRPAPAKPQGIVK